MMYMLTQVYQYSNICLAECHTIIVMCLRAIIVYQCCNIPSCWATAVKCGVTYNSGFKLLKSVSKQQLSTQVSQQVAVVYSSQLASSGCLLKSVNKQQLSTQVSQQVVVVYLSQLASSSCLLKSASKQQLSTQVSQQVAVVYSSQLASSSCLLK